MKQNNRGNFFPKFSFLWLYLFLAAACAPNEKGQETTKSSQNAANHYNPRMSPLPTRTPKPLEEWGIDNGETIISHAFSVFSDPMYPPDFTHFDYVNPDAPQGGTLRLSAIGTFDSFNYYGHRGTTDAFAVNVNESMMRLSADEIDALYPLIAEKIEYAKDFTYVIFHIDPRARFQDGQPITAEDAAFTFNKFIAEGPPHFASSYTDVLDVQALDARKVRFSFSKPSRSNIHDLAQLPVFSQQFWKDKDLAEPLWDAKYPGSGAWKVSKHEMGSYIIYEKAADYWAADLPVNKGINNFQFYRIDYYLDSSAMIETFKSGSYDFQAENSVKNWMNQYTGTLFDNGVIIKAPFAHEKPPAIRMLAFNSSRAPFNDYRIRRAISYALDFEWLNKNLFYGLYERNRSYFQNTIYEAKGLPSKEELAILEPIREQIPPEVFTSEYQPPQTDGSGSIREGIAKALALFREAGWELEDGVLRNQGKPLELEILIYRAEDERYSLSLQENLKKMGIELTITLSDFPKVITRIGDSEFDLLPYSFPSFLYPAQLMEIAWHSNFSESTWNVPRVNDTAIDYLIEGIAANQNDKDALRHWGRAFDRVVQHNAYLLFKWHLPSYSIAHIDKFGKPEIWPKYGYGPRAWKYWWIDEDKLAALPENMR